MTATPKKRAKRAKFPKHDSRFEVIEAALDVPEAMARRMHGWLDSLHALREDLRVARSDDRAVGRAVRVAAAASGDGSEHKYLTQGDQYKAISARVAGDPKLGAIHSQVLQNVADQIERGTRAWMSGKRGPLRYSPRKKYRSFTFTQYGFAAKIKNGQLHLSRLGSARLIGLRRLPGRIKSVTLVFKHGRWFAQFTCEVQTQHCPRAKRNASDAVQALPDNGLDTGLTHVATLATGEAFEPAKPLKAALARLKHAQQGMARQFEQRKADFDERQARFKLFRLEGPVPEKDTSPYSNRLKLQIKEVARIHTQVTNARLDQLRKLARRLEKTQRCVAVEEHGIKFMQANRKLARTVSDVAPGMFKSLLRNALGEGRYLPVGTSRPGIGGNSQTCLCGEKVPKTLKERWHLCPACGLSAPRDQVSANIAMEIAFEYSYFGAVKAPAPGQGVRRGEAEGRSGKPRKAAQGKSRETPPATEASRKRQSIADRRSARTPGAKATGVVNKVQLLGGAVLGTPLSG